MARSRRTKSTVFDTITLEGGLISSAMLAQIADRKAGNQAEADYKTNREAKQEIEELQQRLARIEDEKLDKILKILEQK